MSFIYDLVDTWNAGGTTFTAIKMNVTDSASSASSLLMDLQVGGTSRFKVDKSGDVIINGGTVTTSSPVFNAAQTWNAGAVTFTGLKFNVTDTASANASLLMDLQVGGSSRFNLDKNANGTFTANNSFRLNLIATGGTGQTVGINFQRGTTTDSFTDWVIESSAGTLNFSRRSGSATETPTLTLGDANINVSIRSDYGLAWANVANSTQTLDLFLTRRNAANLRLGATDAASPVAQTLSVQSVVAGTSNTAGQDFKITGSQGTGTGAGGSIIFQVAPAGTTGTAQNALVNALTIAGDRNATFASGVFASTFRIAGGAGGALTSTGLFSANDGSVGFSSTASSIGTPDVTLARDAANTLALRNGTNAQAFRVYNTWTSFGTGTEIWERGKFAWESNVLRIGTEKGADGGTARALEFQTNGVTRFTLYQTGTAAFFTTVQIQGGGLVFNNDNTYDLGASGATRPRSIFVGTSVRTPQINNDGGTIGIEGVTSSFPALKRSSATLQVRLADDSAYAKIEALNLTNGRTIQKFTPLDNQPPATNFATLDTRNSVATLDFDDGATNEEAVFVGVIPEGAILSSGIKVRIFWAATSATSGACRWGAQFEKYGTDIDSDSFDTATEGHSTTSGTSGIVNVTELTCTTIDSLAAGDQFRLKIYRDSSDTTNDTMTGDAELIAVELQQVA